MKDDISQQDTKRIEYLKKTISDYEEELNNLKRKYGIGIYCCKSSEISNGWSHDSSCKNYVLTF